MKVEMGSPNWKVDQVFSRVSRHFFRKSPLPSEVDPDPFNLDLWRAIAQHCSLQDSIDEGTSPQSSRWGFSPDVIRWTIFLEFWSGEGCQDLPLCRRCFMFHAKMVVSGKWCLEDPHPHSQDLSDWVFFFAICGDARLWFFLRCHFLVWEELRSTMPPQKNTHTHTEAGAPQLTNPTNKTTNGRSSEVENSVLPLWSPQPVASCRVRLLRLREDDHVWQVHVVWMWKWDLPSFKAQSGTRGWRYFVKKVRAHEFGLFWWLNMSYLSIC